MEKMMYLLGFYALTVILYGLLLAWPISYLWNSCLVPAIPYIKTVGVAQMWGIMVLAGVLFNSTPTRRN